MVTVTASGPTNGSTTLAAADAAELLAGNFYLNIHTTTETGGEIRGQLILDVPGVPVLDAWAILLLLSLLAASGAYLVRAAAAHDGDDPLRQRPRGRCPDPYTRSARWNRPCPLPSPTIMRATMRRYIELVGKNDVDGVLALFTEDVSVEGSGRWAAGYPRGRARGGIGLLPQGLRTQPSDRPRRPDRS